MKLGSRGESLAARFLKKIGLKIAVRNYESPAGEIDLIALDGDTIVFVEVKTRSSTSSADPEASVDFRKRRRLARAARFYLAARNLVHRPSRFDVIAVLLDDDAKPQIEHFINAFAPNEVR